MEGVKTTIFVQTTTEAELWMLEKKKDYLTLFEC